MDWLVSKYLLQKKIIRRKIQDMEMFLDLVNPGISRSLMVNGIRELDKVVVLRRFLKEGMVVLDCGSNIGYYPLFESSIVKEAGKVYAFEPDPRNYKLLIKNIRFSPYKNIIEAYAMAISNLSGEELLFMARKSNLSKISTGDDKSFLERHPIKENTIIRTISIDEFCQNNSTELDFVRMDIEGYEVEVFQGMYKTCKYAKKGFSVLIELHPHLYSSTHSFAAELEKVLKLNFRAKVIISSGEPRPSKFIELGYFPIFEIKTDGYTRGWYENIRNEDVVKLTCFQPKMSRYILLEKQ